jgi:hypothetical protein
MEYQTIPVGLSRADSFDKSKLKAALYLMHLKEFKEYFFNPLTQ